MGFFGWCLWCIRSSRNHTVSVSPELSTETFLTSVRISWTICRYLQNGNILAARTFITQFVSEVISSQPSLISPHHPAPLAIGKGPVNSDGPADEVVFTVDSALNFAQLAVRTCQRSQGEKNKAMREAWVRLCGTYQSKGGLMATKEVRKVSDSFRWPCIFFSTAISGQAFPATS